MTLCCGYFTLCFGYATSCTAFHFYTPHSLIFTYNLNKILYPFLAYRQTLKTLSKLSNLYSKPKLLLSLLFTKQLTLCLFLLSVSNSAALLFSLLTLTLFLLLFLLLLLSAFTLNLQLYYFFCSANLTILSPSLLQTCFAISFPFAQT
jgi:hypothetical protein